LTWPQLRTVVARKKRKRKWKRRRRRRRRRREVGGEHGLTAWHEADKRVRTWKSDGLKG
jgi:hypothetical protein